MLIIEIKPKDLLIFRSGKCYICRDYKYCFGHKNPN